MLPKSGRLTIHSWHTRRSLFVGHIWIWYILVPHLPTYQTKRFSHHIPHFLQSTCKTCPKSHNSTCPPRPVPSKSLLDKRSWASKRRISYPFEAILDSRSVVHSRGRRVDVLEQQGLNSIKQLNNQILFIALLVCWEPLLEATKCVFSSLSGFDVWSAS